MPTNLGTAKLPELIIGVAGPVGVDIDQISESLKNSLAEFKYKSQLVKLTSEMLSFSPTITVSKKKGYDGEIAFKMDYADQLCKDRDDPALMARIAMLAVRRYRRSFTGDESQVEEARAYIIRQLKRPEEVELLRTIYGKQFILVSAYGSYEDRLELLSEKIKKTISTRTRASIIRFKADALIERDSSESDVSHGQQLRDTFHRGDVFVDGVRKDIMDAKIGRFVQALFGRNDIAPSKDEYGMYAAKSASLRSSDLSRQVGAAVFAGGGELIVQGCNEVPKAGGGTYWDLEEPDFRDVKLGYDPNDSIKKEILRDLFERLSERGLLSEAANKIGTATQMVDTLYGRSEACDSDLAGALSGAMIMDLTEYGRVVHAEMCAICDAARLGRSVRGATLYCTTFPCHNCTKHILASGILKVVYMEPYPKSKAKDLHENEIEIEKVTEGRVSFVPFLGISPHRYRDIFQKGKRKDGAGDARRWFRGSGEPMMDVVPGSYLGAEAIAAGLLFGQIEPVASP